MPLLTSESVRLQPYFGYRNAKQLTLTARALRSGAPRFDEGGRWQAFRTMLAQFASREAEGVSVELRYQTADGATHVTRATSNAEGFAKFHVEDLDHALPEQTAWEVVSLHWVADDRECSTEAFVLAPASDAGLGVISDIDDTIIETGITGNLKSVLRNWKRVLATLPEDRLQVPGADSFYGALGGGLVTRDASTNCGTRLPTANARPFFYVSSSPWNLFSYLVAFKQRFGLPLGPIALRDWGLNRATFGSASHGAHKRDAIDAILADFPDLQFALIGDDTQGDLVAFGKVVADYGPRIAAVFVRRAGEAFSAEESAAKATIEAAGVPLWMGADYATGQAFLEAAGLDGDDAARRVVERIEKGAPTAAENAA